MIENMAFETLHKAPYMCAIGVRQVHDTLYIDDDMGWFRVIIAVLALRCVAQFNGVWK